MVHPDTHSHSVPHSEDAISLKNLLHDLQCSKEAAARILERENPGLIAEWREKTAQLKERTSRW